MTPMPPETPAAPDRAPEATTTDVDARGPGSTGAKGGPGGKGGGKKRKRGDKGRHPVPDRATRHALDRFSYGWTPQLQRQVDRAGGFDAWFERQLRPRKKLDGHSRRTAGWWTSTTASTATLVARHHSGVEKIWEADANNQRWALARRIGSDRQVQELMTEFWEHHLHVPAEGSGAAYFRADYSRTLRAHALGRYSDLLQAAITHPAMGVHLDNASSTAEHPNENLGRELLELHTVGLGHHSEADVKQSARILTGYRVDTYRSWRVYYDPASHATGRVRLLGFTHKNSKPDGRKVTRQFLRHLARHEQTSLTIARKLAVRFVSDDPSPKLVKRLAAVYRRHDTAIAPVLRELVASKEFRRSVGRKVRTPSDDVVATYRALGVQLRRPTGKESAANAVLWQVGELGPLPFGWPRPDGLPDRADLWATPSRFLASLEMHDGMSGGWWPAQDRTFPSPASRMPGKGPVAFADLVDHLSRTVLGRKADPRLLRAAVTATGLGRQTTITTDHDLVEWGMPTLLAVLLDSPDHFTR